MSRTLGTMLTLGSIALLTVGLISPAAATGESVLYNFCQQTGCTDGQNPGSPLLQDGNFLYGVAGGGANGHGIVFRYNVSTGNYKVLYNFCGSTNFHGFCSDGDDPDGKLVIDTSGNLYGTTFLGGLFNGGQVYELVKPSSGGSWTFSLIHGFCDRCTTDGSGPHNGVSYNGQATGTKYDGTSMLFGETDAGGTLDGGTVYAVKGGISEKVLSSPGSEPYGGLYVDSSNNLWGTTAGGGTAGHGIAFEVSPTGNLGTDPWTTTVLYNFCWAGGSCSDGSLPVGVIMDSAGNLFGTTQEGGNSSGDGVLFELTNTSCTEGGTQTFWCNTVKHTFAGGSDGSGPNGDLVMDASGNIFGTTAAEGDTVHVSTAGTVWKQTGSSHSTLYSFCPSTGCPDGQHPLAGVIVDTSGNLYGTADFGGANDAGVIYKYTP